MQPEHAKARQRPRSRRHGQAELQDGLPFLIRSTHRHLVRALEDALRASGLTSTHWFFLRVLWREEGMTQSQLSIQVGIMTPATVAALNSLERKGLIQRRTDVRDRRKSRIYLTMRGKRLESELIPVARSVLATALRGIPENQLEACREVLMALSKNVASFDSSNER